MPSDTWLEPPSRATGPGASEASGSINRTAHLAGLWYFLMSVAAVFAMFYVGPHFMVSGDAVATARRITDDTLLYRLGILSAFLGQIFFLFTVLALYSLFRDVDRNLARVMLVLVCVGVSAEIVNIGLRTAPLVLLGRTDILAAFTQPQVDWLAYILVRLANSLGQLIVMFWGLWLFPFGLLTARSGYFPKVLGYLLLVAGFAYVVTCFTSTVFPAQLALVSKLMFPLYFGELPIVFWLLIAGVRPGTPQAAG